MYFKVTFDFNDTSIRRIIHTFKTYAYTPRQIKCNRKTLKQTC